MNPVEQENHHDRLGWLGGGCAIFAAALAMAATLPGRTHGLGLITTRLQADFPGLDDGKYATINLAATLAGSLLCLPCGWLLDRLRARDVACGTVLILGAAVLWLSAVRSEAELAVAIAITRGVGQSMLSVISLAIIGKSFPRRPGAIMGAYAVLLTILMAVGTGLLAARVANTGWRASWWEMGWVLIVCAPLLALFTPWRIGAKSSSAQATTITTLSDARGAQSHASLFEALGSPCFWTFALATSFFGLVSSGFSLFQQPIFAAYGLNEVFYHRALVAGLGIGLLANLIGGGLAVVVPLHRLLGCAMLLMAAALAGLPFVSSPTTGWLFIVVYGVAGGWITVLFFTIWSQAFGFRSLGRIQGAAQMLTVLASAAGPLAFSLGRDYFGGYHGPFFAFAIISLALALASFLAPVPAAAAGAWSAANRDHKTLALSESAL